MIAIMLDRAHDADKQIDQGDPANPLMDSVNIVRFPLRAQ